MVIALRYRQYRWEQERRLPAPEAILATTLTVVQLWGQVSIKPPVWHANEGHAYGERKLHNLDKRAVVR